MTLAAVAETAISMDHWKHAERTIATAEKGYSDMMRYFSQATGMSAEVQGRIAVEVSNRFVSGWTG
jgi:hypothetical protein